jgi:hypothetical protein
MGMPLLVVMDFFTNPGDLVVHADRWVGDEKFYFSISRDLGPGFDKTLLSGPIFTSAKEAIDTAKQVLEGIRTVALKAIEQGDILAGAEPDLSKTLTQELIDRIVEELRQHQKANTREMLAA